MAEISLPTILPTIYWSLLSRIAVKFINRLKIDVTFEKSPKNPYIIVAYDTARVRYQLVVRTYGWPMWQPDVNFAKIKTLGNVVKKAVSPSSLGEVNGSLRLKLYKSEIPAASEFSLNVDFEIRINTEDLVSMDFSEDRKILDRSNTEIEVLCTNNCDFALEQIFLKVKKDPTFQIDNPKVFILDKSSHQKLSEVNPIAIKKGEEYIKWLTRLDSRESILFKVVAA